MKPERMTVELYFRCSKSQNSTGENDWWSWQKLRALIFAQVKNLKNSSKSTQAIEDKFLSNETKINVTYITEEFEENGFYYRWCRAKLSCLKIHTSLINIYQKLEFVPPAFAKGHVATKLPAEAKEHMTRRELLIGAN